MAKRNKAVFEVVANSANTVIMAGYDAQSEIPATTLVGYHKCQECKSEVILNCMEVPACPVCASSLDNVSEDTNIEFKKTDFNKLQPLCACTICGTGWKASTETVASLKDKSIYCPSCTTVIPVKADDDNKDTSSTDNNDSKDSGSSDDSTKDTADKSGSDDSKTDGDTSEADKELDDVLKKMKLKDTDETDKSADSDKSTDDSSDSKKTDDSSSDDTKGDKSESSDDEDEDEEDNSGDDEEDEDSEVDASELIYHMALKDAKNISVIAGDNYSRWYLFSDKTPIAIAEFENADATVKPIFRSHDYVTAFQSAVANDGGLNEPLMKDFGMTPVKIDLNIDNVTKKLIDEEVADKTKVIQDKLESLSEYFESSVGIASIGIVKGIYPNGEDFRTALVSAFGNNGARQPEHLVDDFLAKNLPNLMKNTVILAKELMEKSPEALNEVAAMVTSSKPRAVVASKSKTPPLAVHSSFEKDEEKPENGNLNRERATASVKPKSPVVANLFSNVKSRVN